MYDSSSAQTGRSRQLRFPEKRTPSTQKKNGTVVEKIGGRCPKTNKGERGTVVSRALSHGGPKGERPIASSSKKGSIKQEEKTPRHKRGEDLAFIGNSMTQKRQGQFGHVEAPADPEQKRKKTRPDRLGKGRRQDDQRTQG